MFTSSEEEQLKIGTRPYRSHLSKYYFVFKPAQSTDSSAMPNVGVQLCRLWITTKYWKHYFSTPCSQLIYLSRRWLPCSGPVQTLRMDPGSQRHRLLLAGGHDPGRCRHLRRRRTSPHSHEARRMGT